MPVHDAYARVTPYELSFPDLPWARERFAVVREEATARGVDVDDPGRFVLLASAGAMLRELRPAEEAAEGIHPHALLLFHSFHFFEAGERLFLLGTAAVRRLLDTPAPPSAPIQAPGPAGYVQLPQHLLWTVGDEGEPPESVDGFFWLVSRGDRLSLLLAAGIRSARPGLSVIPLPTAGLEEAAAALETGGEEALRSAMPGAELEGLYQLRTAGEALGVAARALALLGAGAAGPPTAPSPEKPAGPRPSALDYRRVA